MTTNRIMLVGYSNARAAEWFKQELEGRKVCDVVVVDIIRNNTNPKKLLEELIINKGSEEYDYRMFIVDESIDYDFAENLKHNFPSAHIVLLTAHPPSKDTKQKLRGNDFYRAYEGDKSDKRVYGELLKKKDSELSESEKQEKAEYLTARRVRELGFDHNYIKKPIRNYGHVASKLKQIMVAGKYLGRGIRYYASPEEECRAKNKKAYDKIMANDAYPNGFVRARDFRGFKFYLEQYANDISEPGHAAEIVKRLRAYENEAKKELETIQKPIRDFEDRFPSIVQDPSAFEVVNEEGEKKKGQ